MPENSDKLVLNKVYEIKPINEELYIKNHFILENKDLLCEVFENSISMGLYPVIYFETIGEIRERKLNEILCTKRRFCKM